MSFERRTCSKRRTGRFRKVPHIASLSACILAIVMSGVGAQAPSSTVRLKSPLAAKLQPPYRTYPGVSADILGIRTGMSAAQAEAIAEKKLGGRIRPQLLRSHASLVYGPGNFTIQSPPYLT
ncbi:MAG: hypothetical protein KGO02_25255, partial [Alphaproteobacteria bacterium]|nr:hypothetical protein [Alphaproteobacteria bacterium]